jgi:hypothetical protein
MKKTIMTLILCLISLAVVSNACDHHSHGHNHNHHHHHRQRQRHLRSGGGGGAVASASTRGKIKQDNHDIHAHDAEDCEEKHDHEDQQEQETGRELASLSSTFRLGDFEWASPQAFLDEGGRCNTREPAPEEVAESDAIVVAFRKRYSDGSGNRRRRLQTVVVPLYIHVLIGSNNNNGALTEKQIADQVDVLNRSFLPDFTFELKEVTRTVNNSWFTASVGSSAENQFKSALRQGGPEALNLYTLLPGNGVLGWATLPSSYANRKLADGVCVNFRTVPGGNMRPYNLGAYQRDECMLYCCCNRLMICLFLVDFVTLTHSPFTLSCTTGDTAVHEAGHWFGLFHTFNGGCSSSSDGVSDTPAESGPAYGCPTGRDVRTCVPEKNVFLHAES